MRHPFLRHGAPAAPTAVAVPRALLVTVAVPPTRPAVRVPTVRVAVRLFRLSAAVAVAAAGSAPMGVPVVVPRGVRLGPVNRELLVEGSRRGARLGASLLHLGNGVIAAHHEAARKESGVRE